MSLTHLVSNYYYTVLTYADPSELHSCFVFGIHSYERVKIYSNS